MPRDARDDAPSRSRMRVAFWRRERERAPAVRLDDVRRRLELLLAAMYGAPIPIVAAEREAPRGWRDRLRRWARRSWRERRGLPEPLVASDGARIHLPASLAAEGDADATLARYRLLAVEQAERVARGTALIAPHGDSPLERDLYLLAEAAAVDASIARTAPGLVSTLAAERAASLARRPEIESLAPVEREVERMIRAQLAGESIDGAPSMSESTGPAAALAWARATAARLEQRGGRYRGVPPVDAWGTVLDVPPLVAGDASSRDEVRTQFRQSVGMPVGSSGATEAEAESGGDRQGDSTPRAGTPRGGEQRAPSDDGSERSSDRAGDGDAPAAERVEMSAPTELVEAMREDPSPRARDADAADHRRAHPPAAPGGIEYAEWDCRAARYAPHGAIVRTRDAAEGDPAWASVMLARHAAVVRRLRERFERLRARRTRLPAQRDGEELDLAACVRALVDRRTGAGVDDRLYVAVRPARRGIAIALLVDISGSTDEWVSSQHRVIDVEKIALLLASEALDALGDLYAIMTFSGRGRDDVRLRTVKGFAERNGATVRSRIAALEPEGFTRLGAAVRHATALLAKQDAGHRLLLILSDGKPNDEDVYEGRYGIEDSRQAIHEARASGVFPFCLTVDREGREYLARIFGASGHTILSNAEHLPLALLGVVRQLLAS